MWSIDARCSKCRHRADCPDRPLLIKGATDLIAACNSEENASGKGDGILIIHCTDYQPGAVPV